MKTKRKRDEKWGKMEENLNSIKYERYLKPKKINIFFFSFFQPERFLLFSYGFICCKVLFLSKLKENGKTKIKESSNELQTKLMSERKLKQKRQETKKRIETKRKQKFGKH